MKKWIPLAALALLAFACSKDNDREVLNEEPPQAIVTDNSNDILVDDEIKGSID